VDTYFGAQDTDEVLFEPK